MTMDKISLFKKSFLLLLDIFLLTLKVSNVLQCLPSGRMPPQVFYPRSRYDLNTVVVTTQHLLESLASSLCDSSLYSGYYRHDTQRRASMRLSFSISLPISSLTFSFTSDIHDFFVYTESAVSFLEQVKR